MIDSVFDEQLITHDNPSSVNKEEDKVKSSTLEVMTIMQKEK